MNAALKDQFESDGVLLRRQSVPPMLMQVIVREYEETVPDLAEIPKHQPIVVFWTHRPGERKKLKLLEDMPHLKTFARRMADLVRPFTAGELRLLETVVFNKPPKASTTLHWHQDVSYFPFDPNNQIAVWTPFDKVTKDSGAMIYALGSHLKPLMASVDLHTNKPYAGETREQIPENPPNAQVMEMEPGDVLIHDGRTWHTSGPNIVEGAKRRGLSMRFLVGDTYYHPRPGSAAAFMKQIDDIPVGAKIEDPAFPVL